MNCICNVKNCLSLFSLSTTSSTCVGAAEDHPPWWPTPSCCPASWGPTKLTTTSRTTPTPSATSTSLPASIPTQVHRHTLTCVDMVYENTMLYYYIEILYKQLNLVTPDIWSIYYLFFYGTGYWNFRYNIYKKVCIYIFFEYNIRCIRLLWL